MAESGHCVSLWDTSQEQLAEKLDAAIRAEASPALAGEVVNLSR